MRVLDGGPVMGELLKEGPFWSLGKPLRRSEAHIPEPDPHDLCLMGSGDVSSPFARDEPVRPLDRRAHPVPGTGRLDFVIGG